MSLKGISVKKLAKDISAGYVLVTAASLRRYAPQELKQLLTALSMLQREVRTEHLEDNDIEALKKKNWRLANISRTVLIINNFIRHRRIKMD